MPSPFFAMLSRMRHIRRWGLMRNTQPENLQEHSLQVAVIAHALAVIRRIDYPAGPDGTPRPDVSPDRAATLALFHDAPEILVGDMPTPIKYYNPAIRDAFKAVEGIAGDKLLSMLPESLRPAYGPLLKPDGADPGTAEALRLVKAADKISAYMKCVEEEKSGNTEFRKAAQALLAGLETLDLPEVGHFLREFLPAFHLSLDELEG